MHVVTRSQAAQLREQERGGQVNDEPAAQRPHIIDDQQGNDNRQHRPVENHYRPVIDRLQGFINNHRTQIATDLQLRLQQQRQEQEALELQHNERIEHLNQSERDLNAMAAELEMNFRRQEEDFIRRHEELNQRENQLHQRETRLNDLLNFTEERNRYLHKFETTLLTRERRILPQPANRRQHSRGGGRHRR